MKRDIFLDRRGTIVIGVSLLVGIMLIGLVLISGIVSGGILDAMRGVLENNNAISGMNDYSKLDKESFNAFLTDMENQGQYNNDAIKALFNQKDLTNADIQELAKELSSNDAELKKISNAFEGNANDPKYQEFLKQLAISKSGSSLEGFDTSAFKDGTIEIGEDQLIVKKDGKEVTIPLNKNDIATGSKITIDKDGNVKISKGGISITTDEGTVRGLKVEGLKNGNIPYSAEAKNGGVTIKDGTVNFDSKDSQAEITVGDKKTTVTSLSDKSNLNVWGENSFSGEDFQLANEIHDGTTVEGKGAVGSKSDLSANPELNKISRMFIDKKNVDLQNEKTAKIKFTPKEKGWTYSADKNSGVEGAPVKGNVPIPEGGSLILDKTGANVKRSTGTGATATDPPLPQTDKPGRVQQPPPPRKPTQPTQPTQPGGSSGGGGGSDGDKLQQILAAITEAMKGLAGAGGGQQGGGSSSASPSSGDGGGSGGYSGPTSPDALSCTKLGEKGDEGFGNCPDRDCTKCQFDYSVQVDYGTPTVQG